MWSAEGFSPAIATHAASNRPAKVNFNVFTVHSFN
jgi:hypothetical protein